MITTERVDDIPLILAHLERMQMSTLLDKHFPTHGNWKGLSLGKLTQGWLSFILSESNHRLNHVEPWAERRLHLLQTCLDNQSRALDFSDDRLAAVLDYLSDDARWEAFEEDLGRESIRIYDLKAERVRIDATTAKGYLTVTEDGFFQFGHSKDKRNDLPQIKINFSAIDPLGLPLTSTIVSGNSADDPLYVPEIRRVQKIVGKTGVTFIGDCKMGSLKTRAFIHNSGDYYLTPLSSLQIKRSELKDLVRGYYEAGEAVEEVFSENAAGQFERVAYGYETQFQMNSSDDAGDLIWDERRLVVCSVKRAEKQKKSLLERLAQAEQEIELLNQKKQGKRIFRSEPEIAQASDKIIKKYKVSGLLDLEYTSVKTEKQVRRYGARPASVREETLVTVVAVPNKQKLEQELSLLGWRVYATNQPEKELSFEQAIKAYWSQYLIERGIGRLKGKKLSLAPLYLADQERVKGLVRLLSIGVRVLTGIEFQVRKNLDQEDTGLSGIYIGNKKRSTRRPTTELMLKAFDQVNLTRVEVNGQTKLHLTPLTPTQETILSLLGCTADVYLKLTQHISKPLLN